ncbi:hypothetical protein DT075_04715 [Bacillus licheniformis]|nr:hypothetical protein DT075_04715 [Bacillus licheniformis]
MCWLTFPVIRKPMFEWCFEPFRHLMSAAEYGHKQQIEAEADEKLHPGAFIKVLAYGTKAKSLTEVHEEEIPEGALAAMKTN